MIGAKAIRQLRTTHHMFTRACKKLGIPVKRGKDYSDEQVLVIGHVIETMLQKKGAV